MASRNGKFTELLLQQRIIGPEQLREAEKVARESSTDVGDALVRLGYASGEEVMRAKAQEHGLDYFNLAEVAIPPSVVELVPESVARENAILPFAEDDGTLKVVVSDPLDLDTFEKLRFILNRKVEIALATREGILESINRHYGQIDGESADSMLQEFTDTAIDFTETEDEEAGQEDTVDETSAPVVRLVQLMISEAVQLRASDIHIEPFEDRIRIRYRIDGVLVERDSPPRRLLGALLSRVKILASIDIAERRRPQDGRIKLNVGDKELDLRVSILPTNHGQAAVMRILNKDNIKVGLRQLGLSEDNFRFLQQLIRRPNGIILVVGPTGSGKTTTLYSALNELNRPDRKIITAEDPVEYYLAGINQVEVRHNIGLDFAQDYPLDAASGAECDFGGRDARYGDRADGNTGISDWTLGFQYITYERCTSSITRLIDMGVPSYLVASSVIGILAQRLVRVICSHCKQPYTPTDAELELAGITPAMMAGANFQKGKGCTQCQRSGYRGRLGIFEVLPMTAKMRELTFEGAASQQLRAGAISEGMSTLYADGIQKVLKGVTTLEEVHRVAKQTE